MFKKIAEAYDTLSDAQKRRDYDDCLNGGGVFDGASGGDNIRGRRGFQRAPNFRRGDFDERRAFDIFDHFFASFHDDFFGDPFFERHPDQMYGGMGRGRAGGRSGAGAAGDQARGGRGAAANDFFGADPFFGGIGGLRGGRGGFGFGGSLMDEFFGGDPFHEEFMTGGAAGGRGGAGGRGATQSFSTSFSSSSSRISMGGGGGGRSVSTSSYTDQFGRTVTRKETKIYHPDGTSETNVEEFVQEPNGRIEGGHRSGSGGLAHLLQDGGRRDRDARDAGRSAYDDRPFARVSSDSAAGQGRKRSSAAASSSSASSSSTSSHSRNGTAGSSSANKFGRMFSYS